MTGTSIGSVSVVVCPTCGRRNRVPAVAQGRPQCGTCGSALPWIAVADDDDFDEVAEQAAVPVLVDLWATWCLPCRAVSPALERLARDMAGRLKLVKVDVDGAPGLAERFEVRAVPTLLLLRDGRVVSREVGAAPAPRLRAWLERELGDGAPR